MFAEALIVADEIYYLWESHNCPQTFDTNFTWNFSPTPVVWKVLFHISLRTLQRPSTLPSSLHIVYMHIWWTWPSSGPPHSTRQTVSASQIAWRSQENFSLTYWLLSSLNAGIVVAQNLRWDSVTTNSTGKVISLFNLYSRFESQIQSGCALSVTESAAWILRNLYPSHGCGSLILHNVTFKSIKLMAKISWCPRH